MGAGVLWSIDSGFIEPLVFAAAFCGANRARNRILSLCAAEYGDFSHLIHIILAKWQPMRYNDFVYTHIAHNFHSDT